MKGNGLIYEALKVQLRALQDHIGTAYPRSSTDPYVQFMIEESLVHLFCQSHDRFCELVASFHVHQEGIENCSPQERFAEGIDRLMKERLLTPAQANIVVEQWSAAALLATDRVWLMTDEHRQLFKEQIKKIPRYYHLMSTVVAVVSRFTVALQKPHIADQEKSGII